MSSKQYQATSKYFNWDDSRPRVSQIISSRKIIESSSFDVYLVNPESLKIECASEGLSRSTGYAQHELLNMFVQDLNAEYNHREVEEILVPLVSGRSKSLILQTKRRTKEGRILPVEVCIQQVLVSGVPRLIAMVHGHSVDPRLKSQKDIVSGMLSAFGKPCAIVDANLELKFANPLFLELFGLTELEIIGMTTRTLWNNVREDEITKMLQSVQSTGIWEGVLWHSHTNGELYPIWGRGCRYDRTPDQTAGYVFVFDDKSKSEILLHQLSNLNELTGLPNRNLFLERANQCISKATVDGSGAAVFHIDINNFKRVNELLGHVAGDEILTTIAKRLTCLEQKLEVIANLGADEFVLFYSGISSSEKVSIIANNLLKVFDVPFDYQGHRVRVTASIGIAINSRGLFDAETLLQQAERAVNHAKSYGKSNFHLYRENSVSELAKNYRIEGELHQALLNQEFELYFQPQLDLQNNKVKSAEVLLRWNNPVKGMIQPAEFIPVLEDSELIIPVGEWVIRETCKLASKWQNLGYLPVQFAVNVSAVQFKNEALSSLLLDALSQSKLEPKWLELEITESCIVEDFDRLSEILKKVAQLGVSISLDDFGTGYSALGYLNRLTVDVLKIDQSFIQGVPENQDNYAIMNAIVAMSKALNLKVVAEGVENEQHLKAIRKIGCNKAQGYFVGKPCSSTEFVRYLNHRKHEETNYCVTQKIS